MSGPQSSLQSVAIIGAGIIGLSCALELSRRGVAVTLYEKQWPPRGASWAAAGMLAPAFEAVAMPGHHPDLFELCDAGARQWPEFAVRLEAESGLSAGYHPGPSLAIAMEEGAVERLTAVEVALKTHREPPEAVTEQLAQIEPSLSSKVRAGLLLPSDGQADNRLTLAALVQCVEQDKQITLHIGDAPLTVQAGRLDHVGHDATLLTAGWQTGSVTVIENGKTADIRRYDPALDEVEPIGGQMLSVAPIQGGPSMTIRAGHIYIVPKSDRIVIGATSEPGRVLTQSEPEQIAELRAQAIEICPVLADAPVIESWAGVRPGLKNHAPLIGETKLPGLFVAAGHYRNGILLAPITAQIISDLMTKGETSPLARAFAPGARLVEQA